MKYQGPARQECTESLVARLQEILESGQYTSGCYTEQFEREFKETLGIKGDCIAVSSCTSGLMLVLKTLGVKRPCIPDFTFSATAHACHWACERFDVADIGPDTLTLNQGPWEWNDCLIGVHCFGNPCDIDWLDYGVRPRNLPLVFDAAHALGAKYRGRPVADYGIASVFSLSPTKSVTAGEGGVIVSNDSQLTEKLRKLRNYGNEPEYDCHIPGLNARMSEFHAIIGLESLSSFPERQKHRLKLVEEYISHLGDKIIQRTQGNGVHAWKDFSILVEPEIRGRIEKALSSEKVEFKRYFRPISTLSCYQPMLRGGGPMAKWVYERILQLPLHDNLEVEEVAEIADLVRQITVDTQGRVEVSTEGIASIKNTVDSPSVHARGGGASKD